MQSKYAESVSQSSAGLPGFCRATLGMRKVRARTLKGFHSDRCIRVALVHSATIPIVMRWHNAQPSPRPSPRGRGRIAGPQFLAAILLLLTATAALAQAPDEKTFPPHRVIGNVYYVGSKDLASYLITTPEGHILINSGFEETVSLIRASVEALGFKMGDIKILLASHAHNDHVAGHALAQELTGAKVYVMEGDDEVIASGGDGQYLYTDSLWKPCRG